MINENRPDYSEQTQHEVNELMRDIVNLWEATSIAYFNDPARIVESFNNFISVARFRLEGATMKEAQTLIRFLTD